MSETDPAGRHPRALVGFGGRADLPWQRLLAPGFRHCFLLREAGGHWVLLDPLSHLTGLSVLPGPEARLARHLERAGFRVVATTVRTPRRPAPPAPMTCVETVKRGLGLHDARIVTPRQLWRALVRDAGWPEDRVLRAHLPGRGAAASGFGRARSIMRARKAVRQRPDESISPAPTPPVSSSRPNRNGAAAWAPRAGTDKRPERTP